MAKRVYRKRGKKVMKKRQFGVRKGLRQPVQYFKRFTYNAATLINNTLNDTPFSAVFRLSDVPNSTEFQNLYDQYKITAIKWKLMVRSSDYASGITAPKILSVIDKDDSLAPTNMSEILQYQNLKVSQFGTSHTRYLKPSVGYQLGDLTTLVNMRAVGKGWIDMANPNVPHYGIKGIITPSSTALAFDLLCTYYLAFKNVR